MSKHSRLITAFLSALMLVSAAVYAVSAEDIGGEGGETPGGASTVTPGEDEPAPGGDTSFVEPSYIEPGGEDSASGGESSYVDPGYVDPGYVDPGSGESSYVDPGYTEQPQYDESTVFYDGDGNVYSNPNDVYVGGEQTYTPPATIPSTTVAPKDTTNTKVDEPTMKASDWDTIRASLSNQGKSAGKEVSTPNFRQIKTSVNSGQNDIKYLAIGIGLLLLSVAGFTFVIVSTVRRRKSTGAARANKAAAASSNGMRYRADDDYDDNYNSAGKKEKKPKNGKRYK